MAFKPGQKKPPGSGRKPGQKNKAFSDVAQRLAELDCDPIEGMVTIAKDAKAQGDLTLAGSMYKELAQYIAPKRKSIEHTGADGEALFQPSIVFEVIDAKAPETDATSA